MKINSELRQHLMIGEVCNRFSYNGLIMQLFSKMKIVLLCFAISFCYATRINAEVGHKVVNVKYDNGSSPSIAFISSGEYAGYIAEAHQASKLGSCALWFDIFDPYTEKRVVNVKYEDNASNPSIAFIPSGKYAGYIAEVHQTGNLWFDIFDPYTKERVVNVKYEDNASDPSIAFISSGKYAGYIAEAHEFSEGQDDNLWFNILDQDGERVVNVKYEDKGLVPSIAFISSGEYAGYIAEAHLTSGVTDDLWFDIVSTE
jgi:formylmethanofuran dehydrogenase subunit D